MSYETPWEWDSIQTEYTLRLFREYGIRNVFETGTFYGDTSLWFHQLGYKVYTVENIHNRYEDCVEKFKGTNIELAFMNSTEYIKRFIKRGLALDTFYYLDAHERGEHVPLREELEAIFPLPQFLIMIHDIKVPNHPQYAFGEDIQEKLEKTKTPKKVTIIYPNYSIKPQPRQKYVIGYCILSKGYFPQIADNRFTFIVKQNYLLSSELK